MSRATWLSHRRSSSSAEPGARDLHLRERALVEERGGGTAGEVLGADRGRPVLARPAAGAQRLVAGGRVRLVPVDPLPARLLPEVGLVLAVPAIGRRYPQRPPRLALVVGVADVVVGLVGLLHPGVRVGGRAVLRAEAADVHVPEVQAGLALGDPLGHDLADPARAGEPVRAEAGGDEEAVDLGLAKAELVVGGERLGPVDDPRDLDLVHRRHALAGVLDDLLEAVDVVLEQAPVEVERDLVEPVGAVGEERRPRVALVAAHHEALAVLAVVDEEVGVAQGGEAPGVVVAEGLGHQVLVRHRDDRDPHARQPAELGGEHPAGDHHDLGLDLALVGDDLPHAPAVGLDPGDPRVREDVAAAAAGAVGQREGELGGVEVAVGGKPGGAQHPVGGHERELLLRLVGRDQLERQPEGLRPPGLAAELLHPLLAGGELDAPALRPSGVELGLLSDPPVELDRVHHHLRQRHRAAGLAHEPGGVEGRAGGQLVAVDQDGVVPAELAQVVGDRGPADPAADDHAAGCVRQITLQSHWPPRVSARSSRRRRSRSCARSASSRSR